MYSVKMEWHLIIQVLNNSLGTIRGHKNKLQMHSINGSDLIWTHARATDHPMGLTKKNYRGWH